VDLVDEQDVVPLETGEDRSHISFAFERRTCDTTDADAELLTDDVGKARLAEPRRADEQNVVQRLVAALRGVERDRKLLLDPLLPNELAQSARPQRLLEVLLLGRDGRCQELGRGRHYAAFSA
jgi:hypothetical protein